ncbi:MAG: Gfo/Idh/MocA family oxidoreductase [Pirellulaceae bacterium]
MKKIRWGMIGTGDVAERKGGPALYRALRSELIGVTNRKVAKAESFAARHGGPQVFASVAEMLQCDDVDAVYIATPPESHCELTLQCAAAGKHVLCEKPMALTTGDCEKMIATCDEHSVSLAVAYYRRCFPVVEKIKELLDQESIGQPLRISACTYSQFVADTETPWRLDGSIGGGGFLMDVGTHRFDLMAYLFGMPTVVKAIVGTQLLNASVEDAASIILEFPNNVQATASFQWNSPIARDTLEIVGSRGILWTNSLSDEGRLFLETNEERQEWALPASAPVHLNLVQRFVDHLLDGKPNPLDGRSGSMASAITSLCYGESVAK